MLKLNDNKTELMLITSKRNKHKLHISLTICNVQIPMKQSVKNLGFKLDCHLTMSAHVSNIARTCNFKLRRLTCIHRFLTSTATATLVSAFVLSRIDYCISLLFGSTHDVTSHLQRIQNNTVCQKCGIGEETVEHVMGQCPRIHHPTAKLEEHNRDQPPSRPRSCGRCGRQNLTFQGFHNRRNTTKSSVQLSAQQQQQQQPS